MKEMKMGQMGKKIENLVETYLPEWRYDPTSPDSGTVLAGLVGDMLDESNLRFGKAVHKHKISYLNLFDRLKIEPIEAAASFVRFDPVIGATEPIHIPRGTQIYGESESYDGQIVFETTHGITVTDTTVDTVYTANGAKDVICHLYPAHNASSDSDKAHFTAFDLSAQSLSKHELFLRFDKVLDSMEQLNVGLRILTVEKADATEAALALVGEGVVFSMLEPEGEEVVIDQVNVVDNMIWLSKEGYVPKAVEYEGKTGYVFKISSENILPLTITSIELCFSFDDIRPDTIWCSGMEQVAPEIRPFGLPMEIYSECGFESKTVFSKRGARIKMAFQLGFDVHEQLLPTYEEDPNLKIIMKKPVEPPKVAPVDIYADYVLIEYLSVSGWKRLLPQESMAFLFNSSTVGPVEIEFDCPSDMVDEGDMIDDYRMRFRLMKSDHLYQIPSKQYVPVISGLRFSYDYLCKTLTPDTAVLVNNFNRQDITEVFAKRRTVQLFIGEAYQKHSMYFGFAKAPVGTPFSMYLSLENRTDTPLDITMEYLGPNGFEPVKLVDGTSGLRYSGTLQMLIPSDSVQTTLFDENLFWLRMVRHREDTYIELPIVTGIYLNMAKVENLNSNEKFFYINDVSAPFHIDVGVSNMIHARVWVNERGGSPEKENWVEWSEKHSYNAVGRYYDINRSAGTVSFARGAFSTYPIRETEATVKIAYQSYAGKEANLPEDSIRTLGNAIHYIARASNPIPAFGGYDGYNEETSAAMISSLLRTRGRAVTKKDYMDIINQATFGVRRIKALSDIDQNGKVDPDTITIALLIDQYDQGGYVFSSIKDRVREQLEKRSCVVPLGKELVLIQPHFLPLSVRLWLECDNMEHTYDTQKQTNESIRQFLNPLDGGFESRGWEIGQLPTTQQLLAYLGAKHPELVVTHLAMTVKHGEEEYTVDDLLREKIKDPFAMAVNGEHTIYIDMKSKF